MMKFMHVGSGQHEAMLFTVWLNPQIILITATIANKMGTQARIQGNDSNEYVIIVVGGHSCR